MPQDGNRQRTDSQRELYRSPNNNFMTEEEGALMREAPDHSSNRRSGRRFNPLVEDLD